MTSTIEIRRATADDSTALAWISLLTANAGTSAQELHDHNELPGSVYVLPYLHLATTFAFVAVDPNDGVVGYICGSTDTRRYELKAETNWWPALRQKYQEVSCARPGDVYYTALIRNMHLAPAANIAFSPAHLHINLLASHQRRGLGRRLMDYAIEHLKNEGLDAVWLGLDPANVGARLFYERLGFSDIEGGSVGNMGLRWK